MKKNNKTQGYRPFDNEIRQMRKSRVILISLSRVAPFVEACTKRGIELSTGSNYKDGIILFEREN